MLTVALAIAMSTTLAEAGAERPSVSGLQAQVAANASDIAAITAQLPELVVEHNYAEGGNVGDFAGFNESILALDLTPQITGFLMVWANIDAEHDNSFGDTNKKLVCFITIDDAQVSTTVNEQYNGGSSVVADGALAVSGVGAVTAGDHTVDLKCTRSGGGAIFIRSSSLLTLFVSREGEVPPL